MYLYIRPIGLHFERLGTYTFPFFRLYMYSRWGAIGG